ncbi:MAG: uroporphyrinogen decarboxylase family protein [Bryobacterales bacterium]|nr:uroporphyrinogen decarboxylase family protein [Bryobacterales bacterium]
MNSRERVEAALNGRQPDCVPVMLYNFMMAAREAGTTMARYRRDQEAIARCFIQAVEKYAYDGIVVDIDTATLAGAVGVPVLLLEDEPAICYARRLDSPAAVRGLEPPEVGRYPGIQVWLEAVRLLKTYFRDEIYIRGNCDQAPFSLACSMRGSADWMMDILDCENEEDAHRLLEYCTEAVTQFIGLMAGTGVEMVSNGDSPAGPSVVSPGVYRKFAWPYERRVVDEAHTLGLAYMLHICGKTEPILASMVETGADALEIDHKTDAGRARDMLRGRTAFVGNIDPSAVLALGSTAEVESRTRELVEAFAGEPRFILNAGCAIAADTPPENLKAMIRAARNGW